MTKGVKLAFRYTVWQGPTKNSVVYQHTKFPRLPLGAIREGVKVVLKLIYLTRRRILRKNQNSLSKRKIIRKILTNLILGVGAIRKGTKTVSKLPYLTQK